MKQTIGVIACLLSLSTAAWAAKQVPVNLAEGGVQYRGKLFVPGKLKIDQKLPLVVVIHEWWGKTEYPEMRAKKIADELGYAALAVDLYGEGKTVPSPPEAQALATPFYKDPSLGLKRVQAFISATPAIAQKAGIQIDASRLSAIGYCFGGSQALNLARGGSFSGSEKLLGVVSFHGGLASGLKASGDIHPKVLVLHGAADKMVKEEEVAAFKEEMKSAKADLQFYAYEGALHAFTNPKATSVGKKYGIPVAYDAKADKDSWLKMVAFLKEIYK